MAGASLGFRVQEATFSSPSSDLEATATPVGQDSTSGNISQEVFVEAGLPEATSAIQRPRTEHMQKDTTLPTFPLPTTFDSLTVLTSSRVQPVLPLTEEGKMLIDTIRTHQTPTELISNSRNSEYLCAGYIYELTARLRGPKGPQRVGLLTPRARDACDAWEIPHCYTYYGGNILYDIGARHGETLKDDAHHFPQVVTPEEMIRLFAAAFRPSNLLSDIGFLYHDSNYLYMLGVYESYNTHIAKNMGLSDFTVTVEYPSETVGVGNDLLLRNALGCTEAMRPLVKPIISRYQMRINGKPARYLLDGNLYLVDEAEQTVTPYQLQTLDHVSYTDLALAHFYDGERIDSFLQMSCQGEFYPINVLEINPKFIEKY